MLLITACLTTTSLLLVQRSIRDNVRRSIAVNLRNSVAAFQDFRHERETMLTSDVALLADLPITRAIMGSPDPVTIQDASEDISQIANSDLFVLVDHRGQVVALHTKSPGLTREAAEKYLQQSLEEDRGESLVCYTFCSKLARSSFASKFNVVDFCKCLEARLYRLDRGRCLSQK